MSNWSFKYDLRDDLEIKFNDDFNKFMQLTKGVIYKLNTEGQEEEIKITCPADLIPYYAHILVSGVITPKSAHLCYSNKSYLDENWHKLNELYQHNNAVIDFLLERKERLTKLYEQERVKPIEEQRII